MYRGEEGLLPRASPNLSVIALRAIAQGYRPKKLRETHRSRPFTSINLQFNGFHLNAQCLHANGRRSTQIDESILDVGRCFQIQRKKNLGVFYNCATWLQ